MPGTSFDRVADIYDATRGGERRGNSFADEVAPWISGPRVLEVGVGTGVIAAGLRRHGHDVIGIDLSRPMLERARARIGPRVAEADSDHLPFAADSVDTVLFVWVLHLVHDPATALADACRVLRPGGRLVTIMNHGEFGDDDEVAAVTGDLYGQIQPLRPAVDVVSVAPAGLSLEHRTFTSWDRFEATVREDIEAIEQRQYSPLWDVDDATWDEVVEPALARLRALPDPDRPRQRRSRHPLVVWSAR